MFTSERNPTNASPGVLPPARRAPGAEDATAAGTPMLTADLRIGMRLASAVYAGSDMPLLAAGQVVSEHHKALLERAGITTVTVSSPGPRPPNETRTLSARRVPLDWLARSLAGGRSTAATPTRLTTEVLDGLARAGVREIEVLVDENETLEDLQGAAQPTVGRILGEVLRANRRTRDPATRAVNPEVGRHAAEAVESALETVAWSAPISEMLIREGLRPGFLGPALETALMTAVVATALDWDDDTVVDAAICGLLADIGMLRVPVDIIEKPGPLDFDERAHMERHPAIGAALLRPLQDGTSARAPEVALQHHERVDGGGYPQGLHGDEIDPVAQIVGICHLYLAAVTGRSYRQAVGPRRAFALLEGTAGSAYDRRLVRTFMRSVDPHPVGTQVRLASGDCGRVVGGDVENPQVEIVRGVGGARESRVVWGALGPEFAIVAVAE